VSDKTGWEGRDQQLRARIGTVWTLFRALGPAKETIYALESLQGRILWGCWELKRKFRYRCGSLERAKKRGEKAVVLPGYTVPPDHQGDENVTSGQSRRFLRASHSGLRIGNGSILLLSYCKGSRGFLWQRTY